MKKFHKSQRDPNPSRRVNPGLEKGYPARRLDPGWLLRSCKYLLEVDRRRVDPLRRVEANPGSCKGGPCSEINCNSKENSRVMTLNKMNAHTNPIFIQLEFLKIEDI